MKSLEVFPGKAKGYTEITFEVPAISAWDNKPVSLGVTVRYEIIGEIFSPDEILETARTLAASQEWAGETFALALLNNLRSSFNQAIEVEVSASSHSSPPTLSIFKGT